jgi:Zinc carboxypeptidase
MISEGGASNNPCSDLFAGSSAFSEIETRSISDFYKTVSSNILVYISFHAYGQMLLLPYGHTTEHLDNYAESVAIAAKATNKLTERFGTRYTYGNVAETICKYCERLT